MVLINTAVSLALVSRPCLQRERNVVVVVLNTLPVHYYISTVHNVKNAHKRVEYTSVLVVIFLSTLNTKCLLCYLL